MTPRQNLRRGFTLIEMIAVLAIMAILASVLAPNIASELRRARSDAEDATLANIAKLLEESVARNRAVPGTSGWGDSIAKLSDQPVSRIDTNEDNFPRVYVVDPAWAPAGTRPGATGWRQTPGAVWGLPGTAPSNCRILIVSGSQQNLTAACAGMTAVQFGQVWNRSGGPAACLESNTVRIGRANLTSSFLLVTLTASAAGAFAFDSALAQRQVFAAGSRTFPVLKGSRLSLLDAAGTSILATMVVDKPFSASWDGASWSTP